MLNTDHQYEVKEIICSSCESMRREAVREVKEEEKRKKIIKRTRIRINNKSNHDKSSSNNKIDVNMISHDISYHNFQRNQKK
jgi:hypothetical protein